jgi:metacaspase-1
VHDRKEVIMKKAFLVGINDYPGSGNDLAGCVNDTANLRDLLVTGFAFTTADIRVLTNAKATRAAILEGLAEMVAKAAMGDILVFHYSGHGTQVPDQDGDESEDHLDEALCPHDFSWDGTWIRDDDLADVFSRLPKDVHLEVLLDCCHSGTGTREIALGARAKTAGAGIAATMIQKPRIARRRYLPPPSRLVDRIAAAERRGGIVRRVGSLVEAKPRGLNHVLWAACTPAQYAADAEIGGRPNGAFTWFFCEAARTAGLDATRAALIERTKSTLKADGFDQSPQLECSTLLRKGRIFRSE